jgi:hypothetical protein
MSAKTALVYTPAYDKKHQELVNNGYVNLRAWLPYVQEKLSRVKAMESKELALKTPSNSPSKFMGNNIVTSYYQFIGLFPIIGPFEGQPALQRTFSSVLDRLSIAGADITMVDT